MVKYYIYDGKCGTEIVFKMIGAKWKPWIIRLCYMENGCTFSDIKKKLPGITDSTLANQLYHLIQDGFLKKSDDRENTGIYAITEKTQNILPVMAAMQKFSEKSGYCKVGYSSAIEHCRKLIGNKWNSRIIWVIHNNGVIRFNELKNSIEGISHKVLTEHLRDMERDGLLQRKDYFEKNPKVEYRLTELGEEGYKIIKLLAEFCQKYELIKPAISINY